MSWYTQASMALMLNNTQVAHRKGKVAANFLNMPTIACLTTDYPFNEVRMRVGTKIHVLRPSGNLTEMRGVFTHRCSTHDFYAMDILIVGIIRVTGKYQVNRSTGETTFFHATVRTF